MDGIIVNLFKLIHIDIQSEEDLFKLMIPQEELKTPEAIVSFSNDKMKDLIKNSDYSSEYLNCLHEGSRNKQKFPAVNMIRQLLRCNQYHLYPHVICRGYTSNGKKIRERYYRVRKLN